MKKTFELIEAYDKYIQLLSDECSDLSSMAMVHGWQSTRHKDGNRLREEISLLKMKILTQSAPITHEPASSGQSAEDVLKGMYGNNTQYGYSFNSTIEAMRLHASQVCADKDREIQRLNDKVQGIQEFMDKRRTQREQLESEIDGLNESLTVMLRENAELEKEVKRFNTMRHDSAFVNNVCLSYRHDFGLVAPKERKLIEFECLEWMRAILNNIEFKPK